MSEIVMTMDPWIIEEAIKRGLIVSEYQPDVHHMVNLNCDGKNVTIYFKKKTGIKSKWWIKAEGEKLLGHNRLGDTLDYLASKYVRKGTDAGYDCQRNLGKSIGCN